MPGDLVVIAQLWPARSLLADGTPVSVRELGARDAQQVLGLHRDLPADDRYLRFFTVSEASVDTYVDAILAEDGDAHGAVGAFAGDRLIGVAGYVREADAPDAADVALVVARDVQALGVGTLLLEHLGTLARQRGVRTLDAEVLAANARMMRVFADVGLATRTARDQDVLHVALDLQPDERYLNALTERERVADQASLRSVLRPRSVAVVGAGRSSGVGHAVLGNILGAGFTGRVVAVNPHVAEVLGVPSYPTVDELPAPVDLAVVCVPAAVVPEVARACGRRGVRALVVISSGLSGALARDLIDAVREFGLRLVGPNCLGVVNSDPEIRLDAGFARDGFVPGEVGVVTQSGGIAIALLAALSGLGLGVSTLVSTGDKYDVSGNDLLLWWQDEPRTTIAVLYLESFGNPRKFSRLARQLARSKPVLAVRAGSSESGQRAAASHTAATATPLAVRDALFRQAGVIAVDELSTLAETIAVLARQPLPAGDGVAVVGNVGGAGVLAADALVHNGLSIVDLRADTTARLAAMLPAHASVADPVDTTAAVSESVFEQCLAAVLADPGVHAVMAIAAPTALGDPAPAVGAAAAIAADLGKTLVLVRLGQSRPVGWMAGRSTRGPVSVPCYVDPAAAAGALARAAQRGAWLRRPAGVIPRLAGVDEAAARAVVRDHLVGTAEGGWLDPVEVSALLHAAGLPVLDGTMVHDAGAAVWAQQDYGVPVALKAVAEGLLHKAHGDGVRLGVSTREGVVAAVDHFTRRFGETLRGVWVQPMAGAGRELLVGVSGDQVFGPLVVFGLGGTDTDMIDDRTARLVPLSDVDADEMIGALRSSATLFGAGTPIDRNAVRDVLLRVAWLADLIPEIAELDVNPLTVSKKGCVVVDARVRVTPAVPIDPFLRRLRC